MCCSRGELGTEGGVGKRVRLRGTEDGVGTRVALWGLVIGVAFPRLKGVLAIGFFS